MTPLQIMLFLVSLHVATLVPAIIYLRRWLQRQPDPLAAQDRFCAIVMAAGFFLLAEGAVIGLITKRATTGFALFPVGLCIVASMLLKRKELARQIHEKRKGNAV